MLKTIQIYTVLLPKNSPLKVKSQPFSIMVILMLLSQHSSFFNFDCSCSKQLLNNSITSQWLGSAKGGCYRDAIHQQKPCRGPIVRLVSYIFLLFSLINSLSIRFTFLVKMKKQFFPIENNLKTFYK